METSSASCSFLCLHFLKAEALQRLVVLPAKYTQCEFVGGKWARQRTLCTHVEGQLALRSSSSQILSPLFVFMLMSAHHLDEIFSS